VVAVVETLLRDNLVVLAAVVWSLMEQVVLELLVKEHLVGLVRKTATVAVAAVVLELLVGQLLAETDLIVT
jgi:hypothetical protein